MRYFLAVADAGSLRKASTRLDVAPSVISRQIRSLEGSIGAELLQRSSTGISLTDAGVLIRHHCLKIMDENQAVLEQVGSLRGVEQAVVSILVGEGFLGDFIEHALVDIFAGDTKISFNVRVGGTDDITRGVAEGHADIGIAYGPLSDARLRPIEIVQQPMCLIAPAGNPLVLREGLWLAGCLSEPIALLSPAHGVRQLVERVAAGSGVVLKPVFETNSIDAARRFVSSGLGITFLPSFAVATELQRNVVGVAPLKDLLFRGATSQLIVRSKRRLPKSVLLVAAAIKKKMVAFHR